MPPSLLGAELCAADVWALGMMLSILLCGEPPFDHASRRCARFGRFLEEGKLGALPGLAKAAPVMHRLLEAALQVQHAHTHTHPRPLPLHPPNLCP